MPEVKIIREISVVKIGELFLYPENPREIDASQFDKLKKSILVHGFIDPLIVNKRTHESFTVDEKVPTVVGGNMRFRAAKELGLVEVPVAWIDVDKNQEKVINIALNRIGGRWDVGKLEKMIYELSDKDLALDLDVTGLENWELKLYNPGLEEDTEDIWKGMPDFNGRPPSGAFRSIIVHFASKKDVINFTKLINQKITEKIKYIWYPVREKEDVKALEIKTEL